VDLQMSSLTTLGRHYWPGKMLEVGCMTQQ